MSAADVPQPRAAHGFLTAERRVIHPAFDFDANNFCLGAGFKKAAQFREVGWKFSQWIDVGYWQLVL